MAIVLVRHGETEGNARRVFQLPQTPLSERGLAQAQRVAERLARQSVGHILTSDYSRARTTAEAIRDSTGAPLEIEPLLRERNFGDLRGHAYADLTEDPFAPDYVPPNGESWRELHARVGRAWERLLQAAASVRGDLVVVTHGLVCHSVIRIVALGESGEILRFGNTAVTVIDPQPPHVVRLLGCTAHLDDAPPDAATGIA